jgi:hypothetical protein
MKATNPNHRTNITKATRSRIGFQRRFRGTTGGIEAGVVDMFEDFSESQIFLLQLVADVTLVNNMKQLP